jgi:hypothetical protein
VDATSALKRFGESPPGTSKKLEVGRMLMGVFKETLQKIGSALADASSLDMLTFLITIGSYQAFY